MPSDDQFRPTRPRRSDAGSESPVEGFVQSGSSEARRRPDGPSGRAQRSESERPVWQQRVDRRAPDRERSPLIPQEVTPEDLDFSVRVQLKTLTAENAEMTARHLAMVNLLIEDDPELAHRHAQAAANRAGRLAVVHETLGVSAYVVGNYQLALRELLTHRRLTGSNDQLPIIADSERGMERPLRALEVARGVERSDLPVGVRINLAIALSGARLDLGQIEQALLELEIPELFANSAFPQSPLLFRCYAEVLAELGRDSADWLDKAEAATVAMVAVDEELFELVEEIKIPTSREIEESRPRDDSRSSPRQGQNGRPSAGTNFRGGVSRGSDGGARSADRPARDTDRPARDTDRPARDADRPARDADRPARDTDRPARSNDGQRKGPERGGFGPQSGGRPARPGGPDRPNRPFRGGRGRNG